MPVDLQAEPAIARPAVPTEPIFRLSVDQYHDMIRAGILTEDDRVELLEGWLVEKMGKNPPHRIANKLIYDALTRLIPAGWYVDSQEPITTPDSEPEPDIVIVRGHTRDYHDRHPGPADLALVVEVSETSLSRDRGTKKRIYAAAGVPAYWVANLVDHRFEVYTEPAGPVGAADYRHRRDYGPGELLPLLLDGREAGRLAVAELLP